MKIKEIFKKIEKDENVKFKINQIYHQKTKFDIKNAKNQWTPVLGMIVKKDKQYTIKTSFNEIKVGAEHIVQLKSGELRYAQDLNVNDQLNNIFNDEYVISIKKTFFKRKLYDLSIDEPQLYLDDQGFVHHNTFEVKKLLQGEDYKSLTGSITGAAALYKELFLNNDPDRITIFDDLDSLFNNQAAVNMLKGALDSGDDNTVAYGAKEVTVPAYWYDVLRDKYDIEDQHVQEKLLKEYKIDVSLMTEKQIERAKTYAANPHMDKSILPDEFDFEGRIIFISNLYKDEIPSALRSRSDIVELDLTIKQIVERIESVMKNITLKVGKKMIDPGMPAKKAALKFIKNEVMKDDRFKKFDFRTFAQIIKLATISPTTKSWYPFAAEKVKIAYMIDNKSKKRQR